MRHSIITGTPQTQYPFSLVRITVSAFRRGVEVKLKWATDRKLEPVIEVGGFREPLCILFSLEDDLQSVVSVQCISRW